MQYIRRTTFTCCTTQSLLRRLSYAFVNALHEAPQSSVWEGGSGNHNTFHLKSIQEECLCKSMNQSYLRFIFIKYPPFISR